MKLTASNKLTHRPKNPHCEICARTRSRQVYHKRGAFHRELSAWGDVVAADNIDCQRSTMTGLDDQRDALVVRDLYSGLVQVYPVASKSTDDTAVALSHFQGVHAITLFIH